MTETDTLIILSTIIILMVVSIMFTIYTFFLKKKSQLIYNQQIKEASFESEIANAHIEIKEQTLNYIGQELHDDVGQKLSVARMMTNIILSKTEGDLKEDFMEINQLLGECIQDIRNLSKTFITESILHFGLMDSLEKEINRITKLNLINARLSTNKHDIDIDSKHGLILFRMIQETINNVLKHSGAKNLEINISDDEKNLCIFIRDNGKGFLESESKEGSGLKNVISRAKLINADYKLDTKIGVGTSVTINYNK